MKIEMSSMHKQIKQKHLWVICLIFGFILFVMLFNNVRQKEVHIKEGQLAEETIRANKTIEDKIETEEKKRLAAEAVSPEYIYDEEIAKKQVTLIDQMFALISEVNVDAEKDYQQRKSKEKEGTVQPATKEQKIASLKKKYESISQDDVPFYQSFPNIFYEEIFSISENDFNIVRTQSVKLVKEAMSDHIRSSNLSTVRQNANDKIQYLDISSNISQLIKYIIDRGIVINEISNDKKTQELREQAKNNVSPVMIYQGEVVVREGVQIDAKAIQKLNQLGMTNKQTSIFPLIALLLLISLQIGMLLYFVQLMATLEDKIRLTVFYVLTMTISVAFMMLLQLFQTEATSYVSMLFPAAFTPLVLNLFIHRRASIMGALFQGAFSIFVFYDLVGTSTILLIAMSYMFTGLMAALIKRERIGRQLGTAALWLIIFPILFVFVVITYQGMTFTDSKTLVTLLCVSAGSSFTYLMSVGLHPYIELLLNDDSMIVLNELSNPNHPLLKQLLEEAPGTYHHSMMVASLSANAVADIGGRSLATRVGCYYHDIGKIKHANFFVENLPAGAENPHNFLLPEDSREIIFGHVTEGVRILKEYKMPKMVLDICEQHHGTTLMRYFYVKAKERNPEVKESDFRYPGPKPQTREAGVVSLADTCEAAVRAMGHPTNEKIEEFVHDLIEKRILDGQLDDSGLTLKEIRIVEKSIINGLCSTFHSRIKYPKMKSEAEEMKKNRKKEDSMDITLIDETNSITDSHSKLVEDILQYAGTVLELPENTEMSVTFVNNQAIQEVNRDYRGKDAPTDVISFAIEELGEGEIPINFEGMEGLADLPRNIGDILISTERTQEQADDYGHSFERELGFLAIHGFLHLNGYDHMNPEEEKEMFSLQRKILEDYGLQR